MADRLQRESHLLWETGAQAKVADAKKKPKKKHFSRSLFFAEIMGGDEQIM